MLLQQNLFKERKLPYKISQSNQIPHSVSYDSALSLDPPSSPEYERTIDVKAVDGVEVSTNSRSSDEIPMEMFAQNNRSYSSTSLSSLSSMSTSVSTTALDALDRNSISLIATSTGSPGTTPKVRRVNLAKDFIKRKRSKIKLRLYTSSSNNRSPKSKEQQKPIIMEPESTSTIISFLLELARALHNCGAPAHSIEYKLNLVASSFGIEGSYFYTTTGIFCSYWSPATGVAPTSHFVRMGGYDFDLERIVILEELALDISKRQISISEGLSIIEGINKLPLRYPSTLVVLSSVLYSFAIAITFGLGWREIWVASVTGFFGGLALAVAEKYPVFSRYVDPLSGVMCGFISSVFCSYVGSVNMTMVALSGAIWFVPGLSFTLALSELGTKNLVAGTSRLMSAFSCILQLSFGIQAGIKLGELIFDPKLGVPSVPLGMFWNYIGALIYGLSFCVLLRVPPKEMWTVFVACFLGTAGAQGADVTGNSIGAFFGAFLVCIFANVYSRVTHKSVAAVPIFAGILLLSPGSRGIRAFIAINSSDFLTGLGHIGTMFQTGISLVMGLRAANLLVTPYKAA